MKSDKRAPRVRLSQLRHEISELRHVGAQMASACANLAQRTDGSISVEEREIFAGLLKRWDAISIKRRSPIRCP